MMSKGFCSAALCLFSFMLNSAQGALLLEYNLGQASPQIQNNVLGGNLTASTGLTAFQLTATDGYPSAPVLHINPSNSANTTATAAFTSNDFFYFTLTVGAGVTDLDLSSIDFQVARGGAGTPRGFGIRVDTPSTIDQLVRDTTNIGTVRTAFTPFTTDLSSFSSLQNLVAGDVVTFEIAVFTPSNGSSVEFDNILINGTAVPEPSTLAFTTAAAIVLLGYFYRASFKSIA